MIRFCLFWAFHNIMHTKINYISHSESSRTKDKIMFENGTITYIYFLRNLVLSIRFIHLISILINLKLSFISKVNLLKSRNFFI